MYEKTVAGIHKIYRGTGTGNYESVYDLLSSESQNEIDNLITVSGVPQYSRHNPSNPNTQNVKRIIVDGYIKYDGTALVATSNTPGVNVETVPESQIYPVPVINWIYDTYVNIPNAQNFVVRIFFS